MKFVILIVVLAVGWLIYSKVSAKPEAKPVAAAPQELKKVNTDPVKYVQSLQTDVKKAEDAAAKANAALKNTSQGVEGSQKDDGQAAEPGQ